MLEVEGLHAGYGDIPILRDLSFRVAARECVSIYGHNGMGKTTLLRTLIGLLPATRGRIALDGTDLTRRPPHRRARAGIGYVPQGREIVPALTVRENLKLAALAAGRSDRTAVEAALQDFPRLEAYLDRPGGSLSGGEQQLLALARTLVQAPALVLLDEPTDGIQPSIIEEIADKLNALRASRGLTILLVEQNVDFVAALSDRVLTLQKGQFTGEHDRAGFVRAVEAHAV